MILDPCGVNLGFILFYFGVIIRMKSKVVISGVDWSVCCFWSISNLFFCPDSFGNRVFEVLFFLTIGLFGKTSLIFFCCWIFQFKYGNWTISRTSIHILVYWDIDFLVHRWMFDYWTYIGRLGGYWNVSSVWLLLQIK